MKQIPKTEQASRPRSGTKETKRFGKDQISQCEALINEGRKGNWRGGGGDHVSRTDVNKVHASHMLLATFYNFFDIKKTYESR